jgi:hypothetical protein
VKHCLSRKQGFWNFCVPLLARLRESSALLNGVPEFEDTASTKTPMQWHTDLHPQSKKSFTALPDGAQFSANPLVID